jgi:dihydrofolate reductase
MIRAIAAVDGLLGLANDQGIPWNVPADKEYFRARTAGGLVVMGFATYVEFSSPLPDSVNYVATENHAELRRGFHATGDLEPFLSGHHDRAVWIIGGAKLFAKTLAHAGEIYLTRVEGDFGCTKFFPLIEPDFTLASDVASPSVAATPSVRFQIWHRKSPPSAL